MSYNSLLRWNTRKMLWIILIFGDLLCRKMLCLLDEFLMYLGVIVSPSHVVSCAWEMQGLMLTNAVTLISTVIFFQYVRIKLSY